MKKVYCVMCGYEILTNDAGAFFVEVNGKYKMFGNYLSAVECCWKLAKNNNDMHNIQNN